MYSQKCNFSALEVTCFYTCSVLASWHSRKPSFDLLAHWSLLEPQTAADIQFFERCMSSYWSPDLSDALWPAKQLFRRHSATDTLISWISFWYVSESNFFNRYISIEATTSYDHFSVLGFSIVIQIQPTAQGHVKARCAAKITALTVAW